MSDLLTKELSGDYGNAFDSAQKWSPEAEFGMALPVKRGVAATVGTSLARGTDQLQGTGYALAAVIADTFGADQFAKSFMRDYTRNVAEAGVNPAEVGTFRNIEDAGTLGTYITEAVFENLPNMAVSIAGGGVGGAFAKGAVTRAVGERMVGADVAKRFLASKAGQAAVVNARLTGAEAGAFAANIGQETGSIAGDIFSRTGEINNVESVIGGVAAGAVETVGDLKILKQVFGKAVEGELKKGLVRRVGEAGAVQFLKEGGTEAIQTVIEEAAAFHAENEPEKPFWTTQMVDSIVDATLKGGLAGATFGVGGQIVEEARRKTDAKQLRDMAAKNRQMGNTATADVLDIQADEVEFVPATAADLKKPATKVNATGNTVVVNQETGGTTFSTPTADVSGASPISPPPAANAPTAEAAPAPPVAPAVVSPAVPAQDDPETDFGIKQPAKPTPQEDFAKLLAEQGITPEEYARQSAGSSDLVQMPEAWEGRVTVRRSEIAGQGVFTTGELQEGERIVPALISQPDGIKRTRAGRYVNHADDANTLLQVDNEGRAILVSKRPMAKGEELTVNYREQAAAVEQLRGQVKKVEQPAPIVKEEAPSVNKADGNLLAWLRSHGVVPGDYNEKSLRKRFFEGAQSFNINDGTGQKQPVSLEDMRRVLTTPAPALDLPKLLADLKAKRAAQGAVTDGRLESQIRQVEQAIAQSSPPPSAPTDLGAGAASPQPQAGPETTAPAVGETTSGREVVDPANDPAVGVDINGAEIQQSSKGTFYTFENGRVRTGPSFSEEPATTKQPAPSTAKLDDIKAKREAIAAKMRAKARNLSAGLDPEYLTLTAQLVETYVEEGVIRFADFARKVRADFPELWDKTKGYLRGAWNAVADQNSKIPEVSKAEAAGDVLAAEPVEDAPVAAPTTGNPIRDLILSDESTAEKSQRIRKMAQAEGVSVKAMQERIEAEIVRIADEIARDMGISADEAFRQLVALYNKQPLLSARTSTSIDDQAYSTPAPLAYALRHASLTGTKTSVYDATGGNGMLFIGADLGNSIANELNPERVASLSQLGIGTVTQNDATNFVPARKVKSVHVNPPFGSIANVNYDGFGIRKLEHLITLKALEAMENDGTAEIVLGANMNEGPIAKGGQWVFENYLYSHYHVADNFEVDGELYGKQGAKWPVRVIIVAGRRSVPLTGEQATKQVDRLTTWDDVWARSESARNEAKRIRSSLGTSGTAGIPPTTPSGAPPVQGAGDVPAGTGATPLPPRGGGKRGGGSGSQSPTGTQSDGGRAPVAAPGTAGESQVPGGAPTQSGTSGNATGGLESGDQTGAATAPDVAGGSTTTSGSSQPGVVPKQAGVVNQQQIEYVPRSQGNPFGTLTPGNIGNGTHAAMDELVARVGPIDEFVADRLNMDVGVLKSVMAADQIDGVALAIDQIENGGALVIGDETGIGKGRQAAAIIRYAILQGKIPVFFTKDPKLFSDMFADLKDINSTVKPFLLGDPNKASIVDSTGGVLVKAPNKAQQDRLIRQIEGEGMKEAGFDAIFATYSQVNDENNRQRFLENLADRNDTIIILDEAHEASGDGETSMQAAFMQGGVIKRGKGANKTEITKTGLLNKAGTRQGRGGVVYLSATYAKRPDNMPLYYRTDLSKAAQRFDEIVAAMKNGGVALQQAISEALAKVGQYIRRERDFSGVKYEMKRVENVDKDALIEQVDDVTDILRSIVDFSADVVAAAQSSSVGGATATAQGANALAMQEFASIAHNQVGQLLLAAKADAVVNDALAAIERGEKPVIALMNTMESFLGHYVEDQGIKPGDAITLRWNELLQHALSRTLRGVRNLPNGDTEIVEFTPDELGLRPQYDRVMAMTKALNITFPVSPIDYIIQKLEAKGVKMGEMTGRESGIEYSNFEKGTGTYRHFKKANKNALVNGFNGGSLDGLLLNASGSTGLSIHASTKFKDQRKRHMFIAQPALDINVFVQTLGRIKRTGMLPGSAQYTHLVLPLQAELRPAAVTNRKMKSLNANTTAEAEGGVNIQAEDFLNKYGDQVVAEYLDANPDLQMATDIPIDHNQDESIKVPKDVARKFTGRMALTRDAQQEDAYAHIIPAYKELIEQLKTTGDYDLDIVVHDDWDGVMQTDTELAPGADESSIFTSSVRAQQWEITDNRHVPTGEEMQAEFQRNTGGVDALRNKWADHVQEVDRRVNNGVDAARAALAAAQELPDTDPAKPNIVNARTIDVGANERRASKWQSTRDMVGNIINLAGRPITLSDEETHQGYDGALIDVKFPDLGKGVRVAPSAFQFRYLVNAPGGRMFLPGSAFAGNKFSQSRSASDFSDFTGARAGQRYQRWIITGNPVAAYTSTGGRGKVVRFTTREGEVVTGLMMPNNWNTSQLASDPRLELINGAAVSTFLRGLPYHMTVPVEASGGAVRIQRGRSGIYGISTASSRRVGGDIYLDQKLRDIVGDFTKSGSRMLAEVESEDIARVVDRIMAITGKRFRAVAGASNTVIDQVGAANTSARPQSNSPTADRAIAAIDRLQKGLDGKTYSDPLLLTPLAKLALQLAKALIRAGRTLEVAIREAIAQAKAQMPGEVVDEAQLAAAMTEGIFATAPEPGPAVQSTGESKVSASMEEFTPETMYRTETEQGRNEAAAQFIDQTHGGDLRAAYQAIALATPLGIPDSLRIIIAKEIATRATKDAIAGNDASLFDLAESALVIAKGTGSAAGQALQATNQAIKDLAAEDSVVNFWKANNGLIDRLLSAKFPDVTSSNIKAWLAASGREAVKSVAEMMTKTNNVTARVLRVVGRDLGIDWSTLFTSAAVDQKQWQQDLFDAIRTHPKLQNLKEGEQVELTNILTEAWQRERMKVFRREFKKNVALPDVKAADMAKLDAALPELVKQLNLGLLANEAFRNALAPRYGQKPVTMADAKALFDMAQSAQAKPEGFQRSRAFRGVYDEMRRRSGIKAWEFLQGWWYASVLSGMGTQGRNILGNASILAENMIASVARNPRAAGALVSAMWRGMRENAVGGEFKAIMSGDVTARPGMDIKDAANALELAKDSPEAWKRMLASGRYVTRFMLACDSFFYDSAAEVSAINSIIAQNKGADWATVDAKIFETLNLSPEKRTAAEVKAKAEGLTGTDLSRRVIEILEQQRPSEILDAQHRFALDATLNNEPEGLLGMAAKTLIAAREKVPALTAIVPFVRISANVGNLLLQHSPLGLYWVLRNWRTTGNAEWTRQAVGIREDMSAEEYQQLRAKVLLSHAALAMVFAWAASGADEDEPWFQVTGSMNGIDPDKRRQLEEQGLRPYSVKFGDRSFDYRQTPWAFGLASVGQVMDAHRYDPKWDEQNAAVKLATGLAGGKAVILDQNFLSNLMVLLERGPQMAKDQNANKYLAFLGRTAGGVIPTAVKEADSMTSPEIRKPQSAWDYLQREIPIARRSVGTPIVNVMGEPVERPRYPWSWLTSEASSDPVWQALGEKAQKGVFLPVPSAAATVLKDGKRVKMTPEQFAKYQAEVGKLYKAKLTRDLSRFERMTPEQASAYFKREFEPLREQARTRIK